MNRLKPDFLKRLAKGQVQQMSQLQQSTEAESKTAGESGHWVSRLREHLTGAEPKAKARLRTTLHYKLVGTDRSLLVPPELAEDQPETLQYLHRFASAHELTLIEDRRRLELAPIVERRKSGTPNTAMAISLLLKQLGTPGPAPRLSSPHMLRPGNHKIDLDRLIRIADGVRAESKTIAVTPGNFIKERLMKQSETVEIHACRLQNPSSLSTRAATTASFTAGDDKKVEAETSDDDDALTFAQFHAEDFHAIGYITGDQLVVTVFLGGGPLASPELWTDTECLSDSPFHCQIFPSPYQNQTCGIFYQTFYIDHDEAIDSSLTSTADVA